VPSHPLHIDLVPHVSLSVRGALVFFGATCVVTVGIAGVATLLGFWPILPFAGAEMALLAWALHSNMQRRFERETIEVTETEVVIEHRSLKLGHATPCRVVFPRHWARVKIRNPQSSRSSLVIESHGRVREIGRFLTEEERRHLAAELRQLIGDMNQSPDLPGTGSP
jgi:uncharacterized membrane protein